MNAILPIVINSPIRVYTYLAYYFSVLSAHGCDLSGVLYNHYLTLRYENSHLPLSYQAKFYAKEQFEHEYFDSTALDVVQRVRAGIQAGKYAVLVLNAKHITNVLFDREWYHDWLIYGFDDGNREFTAAGYVLDTSCHTFEYKTIQISYDDVAQAFPPASTDFGYKKNNMSHHFFWLPEHYTPPTLNVKKVKRDIFFYAHNALPKSFNACACAKYAVMFRREHIGTGELFDLRPFRVLQEHKQLIIDMMCALVKESTAALEYQKLLNIVKAIQSCALKYNISRCNKQKTVENICIALQQISKDEPAIMRKFYRELKETL
ncbi:MAG: hypothetical protein LBN05_07640 [Oscillospiraceae bacterium]|jgi:hypothetical protein|nr:hypothetical protein [Oscillospiraceae bacterium]